MRAAEHWIGVGLRSPHKAELARRRPSLDFLEVHAENYLADEPAKSGLIEFRRDYPLSLHAVGLSLGGSALPDPRHLARLRRLIDEVEPTLISDHLAWSSHEGRYYNDLLPLPYTAETLAVVARNIACAQDALGRKLLIENPSLYLAFAQSHIAEADFLAELVRRTGCGLLCDLNNIVVTAANTGTDATAYLKALPAEAVGEIHVAGHEIEREANLELRIDTHSRPVSDDVWTLYRQALDRFGPVPTLVEWDKDLPPLETLLGEADKARALSRQARAA